MEWSNDHLSEQYTLFYLCWFEEEEVQRALYQYVCS